MVLGLNARDRLNTKATRRTQANKGAAQFPEATCKKIYKICFKPFCIKG